MSDKLDFGFGFTPFVSGSLVDLAPGPLFTVVVFLDGVVFGVNDFGGSSRRRFGMVAMIVVGLVLCVSLCVCVGACGCACPVCCEGGRDRIKNTECQHWNHGENSLVPSEIIKFYIPVSPTLRKRSLPDVRFPKYGGNVSLVSRVPAGRDFLTTFRTKESTYSSIRDIIVTALIRRGQNRIFDLLQSSSSSNPSGHRRPTLGGCLHTLP